MQSNGSGYEQVALAELPVLYRVARRLTLNVEEAEDLVGQTLLQGAKAWQSFDGRFVRSWLIRILHNEFLGSLRRKNARPQETVLEEAVAGCEEPALDAIGNRQIVEQILAELDKLPEEYRLAVALCDVEEMSYLEAASALNVPVGTVRSRLFRGRRMLREKLGRRVFEDDAMKTNEADVEEVE